MANTTVTALTSERMKAIEANAVVSGTVDAAGDLILQKQNGTQFNAGHVKGADGIDGDDATPMLNVSDTATVDLTKTGAGTAASPWLIKADVKTIPAEKVDSGVFEKDRIPQLVERAILDPAYRGAGPARVTLFSGGGLSTNAYSWESPYRPSGSRTVYVRRLSATEYRIISQDDGGKVPFSLAPNWHYYGLTQPSNNFEIPLVTKLSSGIVVLQGLVRKTTTPATDEVVGTLPVGYRPDYDLIFGVNNSDTAKYIRIKANGEIQAGSGWVAGYVSLENIAYPAAGVATWTPIEPAGTTGTSNVFVNGWSEYATPSYGRARFWKDPYGFVWTQGMIKGGTTAHNTQMFTMAAANASYKTQHFAVSASSGMGIIGTGTNDASLRYRDGSAGGSWVTLSGPAIITTDAWNNNPWAVYSTSNLANGWVGFVNGTEYIGGFAELRREDGLSMFFGMLAGTAGLGNTARQVSDENIPERTKIFNTASGNGRGRLDLKGVREYVSTPGSLFMNQGNTAWFAMDSLKYVP